MDEKERRKFVFKNGVLFFGLLTYCISSFIMLASNNLTLRYLIAGIIVYPIAGYFWGLWMLKVKEKGRIKGWDFQTANELMPYHPDGVVSLLRYTHLNLDKEKCND